MTPRDDTFCKCRGSGKAASPPFPTIIYPVNVIPNGAQRNEESLFPVIVTLFPIKLGEASE